jgi:hypothetical protein
MSDLSSLFFGPLTKDACVYFYFLTLLFFFILLLTIFAGILFVIKRQKELNFKIALQGVALFCNVFLLYFVNRLLHTMCVKSLV